MGKKLHEFRTLRRCSYLAALKCQHCLVTGELSVINKPDLIEYMTASRKDSKYEDLKYVLEIILATIADSLTHGERIEIRGFGSFDVRYHEPHIGRNPRTGERINVPGRYLPYFKPGKELRERVNERKNREMAES
ncbi:MAG: integration host factor subunit beta [Candidatus Kentron sp. G]|nr:MAG: integration host factor subunit beta [Candidatus Kentron sp. G]